MRRGAAGVADRIVCLTCATSLIWLGRGTGSTEPRLKGLIRIKQLRATHSISKTMNSFTVIIISIIAPLALRAESQPQIAQNPPPIDPKNMDTSVKPGDDFFRYATGAWIKRTEIPPEYSRWGAFNELIERNNDALHTIAGKASQIHIDPKLAPETQKVGDYYASGMDEQSIEAMRTKPLEEELGRIEAMKDRQDVLTEIGHLHSIGINAFFNFDAGQDAKDSTRDIAQAVQGGLGMPDRDYYTKQDPDMKQKREKYIAHVTKMLTLLGEPAQKAADDAKRIMALETKLAEASRTRVQLRDPIKNHNKMGVRQLQDLTPEWNWSDYFNKINLLEPGDINVHQPEFFKAANDVFKSTPIEKIVAAGALPRSWKGTGGEGEPGTDETEVDWAPVPAIMPATCSP